MSFKNLFDIAMMSGIDFDNIEKLDLKNKKDFDKFMTMVDELEDKTKNNWVFSNIFNSDFFKQLRDFGTECHNNLSKESTTEDIVETCDMNCSNCEKDYCVYDDTVDEDENCSSCCSSKTVEDKSCCEEEDDFALPSSQIKNIDTKMQIHRLTQEYVDTMLKPYMEKGPNTTNNINNAYTALFEFACWIMSHK